MSNLRPELHVTADKGILDAAAGMLRDGDDWHLFYQYQPDAEAPSRWAHEYSEGNPFDFYECNDVVAPVGGETRVLAGSVVSSAEGTDLYFTSVTNAGTTIQAARIDEIETLCDEVNEAGDIDPGVRRLGPVVKDVGRFSRFRSPCVVPAWNENGDRDLGQSGWIMVASSGPSEKPVPVVLDSPDGISWALLGPLRFNGATGLDDDAVTVAPRIIRLRDEEDGEIYDILFLTVELEDGEVSGYLVGTLDETEFTVKTPFARLDHGHDFTRPRSTNVVRGTQTDDERYAEARIFGLLAATGRGGDPTTQPSWEAEGWANALSLPRVVTLAGGKLYQTPAQGLPDAVSATQRAKLWTGMCEIPVGSSVTVEVLDTHGEVTAVITHSGDRITLDRLDGSPATAELDDEDEDHISMLVDGSAIELFAGGGAVTMASRFWPENGVGELRVRTEGDAEILNQWRRPRTERDA
ncbi:MULTISPECIES: GH32 C-terminal domain-containing protein [unclassified Corynebacterium]|uniref:GH32 C-terminal domain-containing protein n=1 Tax=unclassified Corynebacterium TaxID=2624378 RepID=UPI0021A9DC5E|nr:MULTISPECIES: GH32 C-terminal domain-containing protein [unclassified Corynebacterium]MCT1452820.1 GH32 C-terminal domain-containing protein [Corynebacterium sp. p3-SID1145]MCT1461736.1 GH32 C-terminal domain-containing protein [Corynebacterium sp. p3-SID1140]MDN8594813.1 GH32 C-terminal domain-containing protein [Corynebacterium sp. P4_F2]WKK56339.1 GH32 C-terminal domain-containing protein [Corynebacterium sp. P4-C1]WKK63771.1 GH32 C-terminal domain-containing protein [Corynebacterium sp.